MSERPSLGQLYERAHEQIPSPIGDSASSIGQLYAGWSGQTEVLPQATPAPPAATSTSSAAAPVDDSSEAVARSSAIMAAGTMVSRVLGLVRTALILHVLIANSRVANVFDTANQLPNMIYILLAGGVINAVLVPQITRALTHKDGGKAYTDRIMTLAIGVLLVITVIFTVLAPVTYKLSDLTATGARLHLGTMFALICLPQIFFYGLYTMLGEVLNARSRFGALMWSPVLANIFAIIGLLWLSQMTSHPSVGDPATWTTPMILVLAGSATLGIVAQALVLIIPLRRAGYSFTPNFQFRGVGLRSTSQIAGWALGAVVVQQVGMLITTNLLNTLPAGNSGKIVQSTAFMLFMLPHSLVTLSLVTALYTRMSRAAHERNTGAVVGDMRMGLRLSAVASVPASIGCFVLVAPLMLLMGAPGGTSTAVAMFLGMVPFTLCVLVQRVFYAYEDAKTPFWMQVICTIAAVVGSLLATLLPDQWVSAGIAGAQSVSFLVQAIVGFRWLQQRHLGAIPVADVVRIYVRLAMAAVAATLAALVVRLLIGAVTDAGSTAGALLTLAFGGLVFVTVYAITARRLRVQEIDELVAPVTRRIGGLIRRA